MARPKTVMQGYRAGKWVVVAEADRTAGGLRKVVCKCLACGNLKEIAVSTLQSYRNPDCECTERVPKCVPANAGTACRSRISTCDANAAGKCCYYCTERELCADNCLNTPDKCGSYYLDREAPKIDPRTGLFKGRTLLAQIGGRKK